MSSNEHVGKQVRCEGCGEPIRFVKLTTGKTMPVNAQPRQLVLVEANQRGRVVQLYDSHFATCSQADMFRRGE